MRIKLEEVRNLRVPSSSPTTKEKVKDMGVKDSAVFDGFLPEDAFVQSPFSVKRHLHHLEPTIEIGETNGHTGIIAPWWNDDLLRQLPDLPASAKSCTLSSDMSYGLQVVARDTSFLTINWRDDLI